MNLRMTNRLIIFFATLFVLFSFDHAQAQGGWFPCKSYNGQTVCDWSIDLKDAVEAMGKDYRMTNKDVEESYGNRLVVITFESTAGQGDDEFYIEAKMRSVDGIITKLSYEMLSDGNFTYKAVVKSYRKLFSNSVPAESEGVKLYTAPNIDDTRTTVRVTRSKGGSKASVVLNRLGAEDLI